MYLINSLFEDFCCLNNVQGLAIRSKCLTDWRKWRPYFRVLSSIIIELLKPLVKMFLDQVFEAEQCAQRPKSFTKDSPDCVNIWIGHFWIVNNNGKVGLEILVDFQCPQLLPHWYCCFPTITAHKTTIRFSIKPTKDKNILWLFVTAVKLVSVGYVADDPVDGCDCRWMKMEASSLGKIADKFVNLRGLNARPALEEAGWGWQVVISKSRVQFEDLVYTLF